MKNKTVTDRIVSRMRELNLKSKDLVSATGASKGSVSQWINGGNEPSSRYVASLAKVLKVTEKWLLQGGKLDNESKISQKLDVSVVRVPLLSPEQAARWSGNMNDATIDNWCFTTGELPDGCFALRQSSDSMIAHGNGFGIPEGAIVFVDPSRPAQNGSFVAAVPSGSGSAIIRKLVIEGPDIYLTPLNDKYPTIKIPDFSCISGVCFRFQQDI